MANRKYSEDTALGAEPADGDAIVIRDVSDTTDGAGGTMKGLLWSVIKDLWMRHSLATAVNDFLVASGAGVFVKKTLAETKTILSINTGDSPQFTGIELGHATDTTITRNAAGVMQVEGVVIPSISSTNTMTNKRVTPRVVTVTVAAAPAINTDNGDFFRIGVTGDLIGVAITSLTTNLTGTPTHGQEAVLEFLDDGTARAITHGTSFRSGTTATLITTTVISKLIREKFMWDSVDSKWDCVAVWTEA